LRENQRRRLLSSLMRLGDGAEKGPDGMGQRGSPVGEP